MKCCICGNTLEGYGNNPDGAVWKKDDGEIEIGKFKSDDRCCDNCNSTFVIPGRIYLLQQNKKIY